MIEADCRACEFSSCSKGCEVLKQKLTAANERAEKLQADWLAEIKELRTFALGIEAMLTPAGSVSIDGNERLGHILQSIKTGVTQLQARIDESQNPVGEVMEFLGDEQFIVRINRPTNLGEFLFAHPIIPPDKALQARVKELEEALLLLHEHARLYLPVYFGNNVYKSSVKALATITTDQALQRALLDARIDEHEKANEFLYSYTKRGEELRAKRAELGEL